MSEEDAKKVRTKAKRIFTRKKNAYTSGVETDIGIELVSKRFDELTAAWVAVQEAHENLVEARGVPDDVAFDEWLLGIEEIYQDAELRKTDYCSSKHREQEVKEIEVRDKLKLEFHTSTETQRINDIEAARCTRN